MADTVSNTVLARTKTYEVISSAFTIDGTEAADLVLADRSTFTGPDGTEPGRLVVEQIEFHISGCQIKLEFEHNTDDAIITLSGDGLVDFTGGGRFHGFIDPNSAGGTGDIVATTLNTDAGDTAHIVLYLRKKD